MKFTFSVFTVCAFILFTQTAYSQECDIVILKDGTESSVIVFEIRVSEITYKKCDFQTGPMYIVPKSDVFMIKYRNGQNEVIKNEAIKNNEVKTEPTQSTSSPKVISKNERKVEIKSNDFLVSSKECINFHNVNGEINTGIILKFHGNNITFKKCDENEKMNFTKWKKDLDFITNNEGTIIYIKN
jgi:hypothetical protein